MCYENMYSIDPKAIMAGKVKRALELEREMSRLNGELKRVREEYTKIMDDPYIYDKVNGLKMGGIL